VANHQARLSLADTKLFQGEHAAAVELLQKGLALSDDRRTRQALAQAYIVWADTFPLSEDTAGRKVELLELGLRADPHNPVLFDRLMRLLGTDGPTSDSARKMLQAQLAQGQAPALVHLMLGTDAGQRGESERALFHLGRAHEIDPGMSVVANNLAWFLAHSEPPDLSRALSLMDTVITRWPDRAEFRDTRGHILIKLKRWDDALRDLELALPGLRDSVDLHVALARVYRHKELDDLASEHERIAARLRGDP
jgi:tetratricopeptide (TPR) repeat protein